MSEEQDAPDLLDLKFLPAWLKETPNKNAYADYAGEEDAPERTRERRGFERQRDHDRARGPKKARGAGRPRGPRFGGRGGREKPALHPPRRNRGCRSQAPPSLRSRSVS